MDQWNAPNPNARSAQPPCPCGPSPSRQYYAGTARRPSTWPLGSKDHLPMTQALFTREERDFAHRHGVLLDRRYSHTVKSRYLANVCAKCGHMQGDWFMYFDPYRDVLSIANWRKGRPTAPATDVQPGPAPGTGPTSTMTAPTGAPCVSGKLRRSPAPTGRTCCAPTLTAAAGTAATSAPSGAKPDSWRDCSPGYTTSPAPRAAIDNDP